MEENQIYASPWLGSRRPRANKPRHEVVLSCSLPRGWLPSLDNFYSSSKKGGLDVFSPGGATGIKEVFPEPALPLGVSAPSRKPGGFFPGERVAPLLALASDLSMRQCLFFFCPKTHCFLGKALLCKALVVPLHRPLPSSAACTTLRMVETVLRLSCDEVLDDNVGR